MLNIRKYMFKLFQATYTTINLKNYKGTLFINFYSELLTASANTDLRQNYLKLCLLLLWHSCPVLTSKDVCLYILVR